MYSVPRRTSHHKCEHTLSFAAVAMECSPSSHALVVHQMSLRAFATQRFCVFSAREQRNDGALSKIQQVATMSTSCFKEFRTSPVLLLSSFPPYSTSIPRVWLTERGGARRMRMVALNRSTQLSMGILALAGRQFGYSPLTPLVRNRPRICHSSVACDVRGQKGASDLTAKAALLERVYKKKANVENSGETSVSEAFERLNWNQWETLEAERRARASWACWRYCSSLTTGSLGWCEAGGEKPGCLWL